MDLHSTLLLLAIALPLLGSPVVALLGRWLGPRVGWVALGFPLISSAALVWMTATLDFPDSRRVIEWEWVPSIGLNLTFIVDGFSIFFALIVSIVGALVIFYSLFYFEGVLRHAGRFYAYLVFFMGAMLGTVFANHLLLLYTFWELTSIASFLLIGFLHGDPLSRIGARQALLVTSATGLVMFVGLLLLEQLAGTANLAVLLAGGLPWAEHGPMLTVAMVLMMIGAFGKSAQFPFQFWLPNAMTAPTPVSAYLHSATMVKLGVFLAGRFFPLFAENNVWVPLLGGIGFTTMALGAILALLSHDLKAILAYSSVSQLGYLIGYYGFGPVGGVSYDYLHILNHVFYKGSLFMIVGIVAHATGIRDIRQLGGLFRRLPLLGIAALIATAAMAGLPLTTGFLSKEMVLVEIFEAFGRHGALGFYAVACVIVGSVVKVAFSARLFVNIFLGVKPGKVRRNFHDPGIAMVLPPLFLSLCALVFGIFPQLLDHPLRLLATDSGRPVEGLALWHGFTVELAISSLIVACGFGLYAFGHFTRWRWYHIPSFLRFDRVFERGVDGLFTFSKAVTRRLRADSPNDYLPIIVAFMVFITGIGLYFGFTAQEPLVIDWTEVRPLRVLAATLISLSMIGVLFLRQWASQLISISVAGFFTCFYFVLYRAPDLALTQLLIDSATLFMVLLLLARFPRAAQTGEENPRPLRRRLVHGILSLSVGAFATLLILTARPHEDPIGNDILSQTIPLAHGTNAVNTMLVDFRAFDTLGEISVLLIATLGCLGLLMRYKRTPEEYRRGALKSPSYNVKGRTKP
ncbi:MAG TPA: hydrogen gas-evolving membrane-bound hydrogenase subunit E [Chthoniobacteraceae bacterium]|nr:hydrogen gas-evolving membrane-bound hydrogenase subunit E [Chthoniobacteraceae bacterium]